MVVGEYSAVGAPAKWENGLKGPRHLEFPLADEYTLGEKTQLDQITVADITRKLIENGPYNKPQPARGTWACKLDLTHDEWKHVAKLYTHPLLKHTDKRPHFKHITHRRLGTGNTQPVHIDIGDLHEMQILGKAQRKLDSPSQMPVYTPDIPNHRSRSGIHPDEREIDDPKN